MLVMQEFSVQFTRDTKPETSRSNEYAPPVQDDATTRIQNSEQQ